MKFLALLLLLCACAVPPMDPSIPSNNNHLRIEMKLGDRTFVGQHEIFYADRAELEGQVLEFPPVYKGSLELYSTRCAKSFSLPYKQGETIKVAILDLLPDYDTSCDYSIVRRVIGADHPMIGQFTIAHSSETSPLKAFINGKLYNGVAHLQVREGSLIPVHTDKSYGLSGMAINESKVLTIHPLGLSGTITFNGCKITYPPIDFVVTATSSVKLDLAEIFTELTPDNSCDYTIMVVNYDRPEIEELTLSLNVYRAETQWLESPYFEPFFQETKFSFINPYVMAVSVNEKVCYNKTECALKCSGKECIVRAITRSGRFFWGKFVDGQFVEVQ